MYALVFRKKTSTMGETPTAASPVPAPPETATDVMAGKVRKSRPLSGTIGASDAVAVTAIAPVASTWVTSAGVVSESMNACVSMSRRMLTTIAAPTALPSRENAPASARLCSPSGAVAVTLTAPVDVRRAPLPTDAVVSEVDELDGDRAGHADVRLAAGGGHAPDR